MMKAVVDLHLDLYIRSMTRSLAEKYIEKYKEITGITNKEKYVLKIHYVRWRLSKNYDKMV